MNSNRKMHVKELLQKWLCRKVIVAISGMFLLVMFIIGMYGFYSPYKNTSYMSDEATLEYVLGLTETEYSEFLTSIPKDEATRVMNLYNAYCIEKLAAEDDFEKGE